MSCSERSTEKPKSVIMVSIKAFRRNPEPVAHGDGIKFSFWQKRLWRCWYFQMTLQRNLSTKRDQSTEAIVQHLKEAGHIWGFSQKICKWNNTEDPYRINKDGWTRFATRQKKFRRNYILEMLERSGHISVQLENWTRYVVMTTLIWINGPKKNATKGRSDGNGWQSRFLLPQPLWVDFKMCGMGSWWFASWRDYAGILLLKAICLKGGHSSPFVTTHSSQGLPLGCKEKKP